MVQKCIFIYNYQAELQKVLVKWFLKNALFSKPKYSQNMILFKNTKVNYKSLSLRDFLKKSILILTYYIYLFKNEIRPTKVLS